MSLYDTARSLNKALKERKRQKRGTFVSHVRRIERVAPKKTGFFCAMTFDDGPCAVPPHEGGATGLDKSLTRHLADTLAAFGSRATFDIVGDTSSNYPDERGKQGSQYWGGRRFDHYPDFNMDGRGGAQNCPELVEYLLEHGMELANHGYRHMIFGPMRAVYGSRAYFKSLPEVLHDLRRLHSLVQDRFGFCMKLSRPPHYIDGIRGGFSSYDAYELMGYNYMAASFDGGGWLPTRGDVKNEARIMAEAVERALERDPGALNGQIIFQKDGCNMSRDMPVAEALPIQLEALISRGYEVLSVSELLALSPFEDIGEDDACFEAARRLERDGRAVCRRDNAIHPDEAMTCGELIMLLAPREAVVRRLEDRLEGKKRASCGLPLRHPYASAMDYALELGLSLPWDAPLDSPNLVKALKAFGHGGDVRLDGELTRAQAIVEADRNIFGSKSR